MAVDAVMGDVKGGALKPSDLTCVIVPFANRMPGRKPVHETFGLLSPEHIRLRHRLLVHFFVASAVNICGLRQIGDNFVDSAIAHGNSCECLSYVKFEVNSLTSGQAPLWEGLS